MPDNRFDNRRAASPARTFLAVERTANLHVMDAGDSAFFAWEVGWTVHALKTDPAQLPHANIFHPMRYKLGMDEPVLGTTLLVLPLALFTDDAVLLYNVVRLLTWLASALAAYWLARELGAGEWIALTAGALFAFSPIRTDQVAHLSTLGTQWGMSCATENVNFTIQDNRVGGVGTVVTSQFNGGTFTFFPGGWPWGEGTGTLATTTLITTVQFIWIGGFSTPVASVVNGNTSGLFAGGCALEFAIGNGAGVGETTSQNSAIVEPADYPTFLDGTCAPAAANQQFGSWGNVLTITVGIHCPVAASDAAWSNVKSIYR